jgi:hypothetical protein
VGLPSTVLRTAFRVQDSFDSSLGMHRARSRHPGTRDPLKPCGHRVVEQALGGSHAGGRSDDGSWRRPSVPSLEDLTVTSDTDRVPRRAKADAEGASRSSRLRTESWSLRTRRRGSMSEGLSEAVSEVSRSPGISPERPARSLVVQTRYRIHPSSRSVWSSGGRCARRRRGRPRAASWWQDTVMAETSSTEVGQQTAAA